MPVSVVLLVDPGPCGPRTRTNVPRNDARSHRPPGPSRRVRDLPPVSSSRPEVPNTSREQRVF